MHLLKARSKPVPTKLKRRKIQILGTYKEYAESKKKPIPQDPKGQPKPQGQNQNLPPGGGSSILQFMAPGPNTKDQKMN